MSDIYHAMLKGNQLEWLDDFPHPEFHDRKVEVLVTVLYGKNIQPDSETDRGKRMAECLEKIAGTGGIEGISDPLEWQTEIRRDRTVYDC